MDSSAGAETSLCVVDPLLMEAGFDLHLAVLTEHQSLVPRLRDQGVHVHDLSGMAAPVQLRELGRLARRIRPDLIHASLIQAALPVQALGPLLRTPVLVTWASTPVLDGAGAAPWKRRVLKVVETSAAMLSRCRFHAVTEGVARTKANELHVGSSRVRVAERGRDPLVFHPPDEAIRRKGKLELGLEGDEFALLAVGRQEPEKGYPSLVRAFDTAAESGPPMRLFIAGRQGSASPALEAEIAKSRRPERIVVLGARDDIPELLGAVDALVCSSLREGAAGAVIEAMAVGAPVLSVHLDGLVGVLSNEVNALVVPLGQLAGGILRMANDPDLRRRLAESARSTFLDRFTVDRSAAALAEVYRWAATT